MTNAIVIKDNGSSIYHDEYGRDVFLDWRVESSSALLGAISLDVFVTGRIERGVAHSWTLSIPDGRNVFDSSPRFRRVFTGRTLRDCREWLLRAAIPAIVIDEHVR